MHSFFLLFILLFSHRILHALKLVKYLKTFGGEIFLPHHFTEYAIELLWILE